MYPNPRPYKRRRSSNCNASSSVAVGTFGKERRSVNIRSRAVICPHASSPMTKGCVATVLAISAAASAASLLRRWSTQIDVSTRITVSGNAAAVARATQAQCLPIERDDGHFPSGSGLRALLAGARCAPRLRSALGRGPARHHRVLRSCAWPVSLVSAHILAPIDAIVGAAQAKGRPPTLGLDAGQG